MQEAAKAPWDFICHWEERKQASIVYQFQSICVFVSLWGFRAGWRLGIVTYRNFALWHVGAAAMVAVVHFDGVLGGCS